MFAIVGILYCTALCTTRKDNLAEINIKALVMSLDTVRFYEVMIPNGMMKNCGKSHQVYKS